MVVEDNICYNLSSQGFHHHIGRENLIRNNIFAFGREAQVILTRFDEHNAVTFERNIVITDGQPLFTGRPGQLEKGPFRSDLNLFWDVAGRPPFFGPGRHNDEGAWILQQQYTLDQWQALGNDQHSAIADPRCRDLSLFDFTLAPDSPAVQLGFKPVDMSDVGPRSV